jgi:alpha-1,3-glucosyltransferase
MLLWVLLYVLALLIRVLVGLHGHSGLGQPPMFGDFEAQRHWLEVTANLPLSDWYRNTADNDLLYWGLDYPPLTAYISLLFAIVAQWTGCSEVVAWETSRGQETDKIRLFMRLTVLFCDAVIFIPASILALQQLSKHWPGNGRPQHQRSAVFSFFVTLTVVCCPGLLLIDHGHFQYNGVCIGLTMTGVYFICSKPSSSSTSLSSAQSSFSLLLKDTIPDMVGSVFFCLSLNFKQMALYYAPIFFCALLFRCCTQSNWVKGIGKLTLIGGTMVACFAILWAPFCFNPSIIDGESCLVSLGHVLHRQFPFNRGVFEDKVSNVWYTLSVVVDIRQLLTLDQLIRLSLIGTLTALLPVMGFLLQYPTTTLRMYLSLIVSALSFFLFSFQVHEKSILLATVPSLLLLTFDVELSRWFQMIALFSMFPLLKRDQLEIPYIASILLFNGLVTIVQLIDKQNHDANHSMNVSIHRSYESIQRTTRWWLGVIMQLSYVGMFVLHLLELSWQPPARYPDLYPALFAIFSAFNFFVLYVYHCLWLWMTNDEVEMVPVVKAKLN